MTTHHLKIWPEFFEPIISRHKRYEIRNNDRDFKVDDHLHLQEWDPKLKTYSGRECTVRVVHITQGSELGELLEYNRWPIAIMGIEPVLDNDTKHDRLFVSPHYFNLLSLAISDWGNTPRHFEDFSEFLNLIKYGLKANRRDTVLEGMIKEEGRMLTDPQAFEL